MIWLIRASFVSFLFAGCTGQRSGFRCFDVVRNATLVDGNRKTLAEVSLEECLSSCLLREDLEFECRSAMYYGAADLFGAPQCLLNGHTKDSLPSAFVQGPGEVFAYFENTCSDEASASAQLSQASRVRRLLGAQGRPRPPPLDPFNVDLSSESPLELRAGPLEEGFVRRAVSGGAPSSGAAAAEGTGRVPAPRRPPTAEPREAAEERLGLSRQSAPCASVRFAETSRRRVTGAYHSSQERSGSDCRSLCASSDECAAASFAGGICQLSTRTEAQLATYGSFVHFAKVCLDGIVFRPTACPHSFSVFPQHVLRGEADRTVTEDSLVGCARSCVEARDLGCSSALYYATLPVSNCVLNRENRTSVPSSFGPASSSGVSYVEVECADDKWDPPTRLLKAPTLDPPVDVPKQPLFATERQPDPDYPIEDIEESWLPAEWRSFGETGFPGGVRPVRASIKTAEDLPAPPVLGPIPGFVVGEPLRPDWLNIHPDESLSNEWSEEELSGVRSEEDGPPGAVLDAPPGPEWVQVPVRPASVLERAGRVLEAEEEEEEAGHWTSWSECSEECGGCGVTSRTRNCPDGFPGCVRREQRLCGTAACEAASFLRARLGARLPLRRGCCLRNPALQLPLHRLHDACLPRR